MAHHDVDVFRVLAVAPLRPASALGGEARASMAERQRERRPGADRPLASRPPSFAEDARRTGAPVSVVPNNSRARRAG